MQLNVSYSNAKWSTEEIFLLREGVNQFGTNHWESVSQFVKTRKAVACSKKWTKLSIENFTVFKDKLQSSIWCSSLNEEFIHHFLVYGRDWRKFTSTFRISANKCSSYFKVLLNSEEVLPKDARDVFKKIYAPMVDRIPKGYTGSWIDLAIKIASEIKREENSLVPIQAPVKQVKSLHSQEQEKDVDQVLEEYLESHPEGIPDLEILSGHPAETEDEEVLFTGQV